MKATKKKYTKCQCCPYYAKDHTDKKWKCARAHIWSENRKCIFSYSDTTEESVGIIERWIKANESNKN